MAPSLWTLCSWPAQPRSLIVSRFLANHVVSPFSLPPFSTCAPLYLTSLCNPTPPTHLLGNPHTSFQSLMVSRLTRVQVVLLTWCAWDGALEERSCCLHESCTLKLWDMTGKGILGWDILLSFAHSKSVPRKMPKWGHPCAWCMLLLFRFNHQLLRSRKHITIWFGSAISNMHQNLYPSSWWNIGVWGVVPLVCAANVLHTGENHQFHSVLYCLQCKRVTRLKPGLHCVSHVCVSKCPGTWGPNNEPTKPVDGDCTSTSASADWRSIYCRGSQISTSASICKLGRGGEAQLHFDFNLAPRRGEKKGEGWDFLGGIRFQLRFQLRAAKLGRGGWFSDALRLRAGPKAGGAVRVGFLCAWGSGQILTSASASKRKPRAGSLAFWLQLLKVWGLRAGWGFGCTSTSTLTSPFLKSRCVWETTNQATSVHVDFGLDLEGCESKNIGLLVVRRLQYKTWEFWSFLLSQRKTWCILNGPPQNVGASVALHRSHCETWDFPFTLCWSQRS